MADDSSMARLADALTAFRFVLSLPVALATAGGHWTAVGVLLASAWLSDFFDGRLGRRGGGGRLGALDLAADTAVGSAAVLGLAWGGRLHPGVVAVAVVCGLGYLLRRNVSLAMLTQAVGYGGALWWMYREGTLGFVVAALTVVFVAALDADRFRRHVLPAFFGGLRPRRLFGRSGG